MTKLFLSFEPTDKAWLKREAARRGVSMAEVVRSAVRDLQERKDATFGDLLSQTCGVWRGGDGLRYQRRLRS